MNHHHHLLQSARCISGDYHQTSGNIQSVEVIFIGNLNCLLFHPVNIHSTNHVHQDAHLAVDVNYSCGALSGI